MRLADFIAANLEPILAEWEAFARKIWPGPMGDVAALRDHAEAMLQAIVADMRSPQSSAEQAGKSMGVPATSGAGRRITAISTVHAIDRVHSGFDMIAVASEYRALRASVLRLWRESAPSPDLNDLDDMTRFNETIDQSVAEAIESFARTADRSRQMFLAVLGHDLRNPLNAIAMSAAILRTQPLDNEAAEWVAQIASSSQAMATMIHDLLDFTSGALGGAMPLSCAVMDMSTVCREVIAEMRAGAPGRTVNLDARGELTGHWDPARLRQLVSNLVGNALQHGGGSGPVRITLDGAGSDVILTVHNGGEAIPSAALPSLFDPLVRNLSPELRRQRRPGSIGLGLYIAREIATAHGGTIAVTSTADTGTTFTVTLPRRAN